MSIFTVDKSVRIESPRHLTLRHARRSVVREKRAAGTLAAGEDIPEPSLEPGQEQLHSYWAPGLDAGPTYKVKVTQTLSAPDNPDLRLEGEQSLTVDAPQFTLPAGSVHSTYPPAGYSEDHRYLPHVVLTDPHLPWERLAAPPVAATNPPPRNRVPWLALLAFSPDELRLGQDVLNGPTSIFAGTSLATSGKPVAQTDTLAVSMTVGDALLVTDTASPFTTSDIAKGISKSTKEERGDFIFLAPDLFYSLFSPFDAQGKRNIPKQPDTSPYQYMSHVRNINTSGMALAGVEDTGVFSIVISPRCGMLDNAKPSPVAVHLVSIEGVEDMNLPLSQNHVALCSLYSWTYTVLPVGQLNVADAFNNIGTTLGVLQPPSSITKQFEGTTDPVATRIGERMKDGYSLVKYRTQTGEPTMAFFRGPLTPHVVATIPQLTRCSISGVDFQIMDQELGIMDLSYSSAWQLGRALGLANQPYCAALGRLRTAIQKRALKLAKIDVVKEIAASEFRTRSMLFENLSTTVKSLAQITLADSDSTDVPFVPGGPLKRWHRPLLSAKEYPPLAFDSPRMSKYYQGHANDTARKLAKAADGKIYDETNSPQSPDWMIVLAFLMDRKFLAGVPAHYLITDPSHLEKERLKFFYIDPNWIDAMIDGALSLGNHNGEDKDRVAIKEALNDYIKSTPDLQSHPPQIPTYGFFLRSDLVSRFPDLRVTTQSDPGVTPVRAPLLRHDIIADGVMIGLFDQVPGSKTLTGLEFTQPPHQQRFAVANNVDTVEVKVDMMRQYTVDATIREKDTERHKKLDVKLPQARTDADQLFIWGSSGDSPEHLNDVRMLRLPRFPQLQLQSLIDKMGEYTDSVSGQKKKYFDDNTATSALFAMQLTDRVYRLIVNFSASETVVALASLAPSPPSDLQAVRTLKIVEPPTVDKPYKADESENESDSDDATTLVADDDDLAAKVSFDRPSRDKPPAIATTFDLAPHITQLPEPLPASSVFAAVGAPDGSGDAASNPDFHCAAYTPNDNGYSLIYTTPKVPRDIIFSVHVTDTVDNPAQLEEFEVRLRLAGVNPKISNCLLSGYKGTGASMLSNLRFNVLVQPWTENNITWLSLRVIPRAARGFIDVAKMGREGPEGKDLSFILGMAEPNIYTDRKYTLVDIETWCKYVGQTREKLEGFQVTLVNDEAPPS